MVASKRKTVVYIDGFNLFHGLKESGWKKYYWLDLAVFSSRLMSPMQQLVRVRYFTSRSIADPQEQKRQNTYIEALETLKVVDIQYGKYTSDDWECHSCGRIAKIHHEKQTDVNIAIALLADAQDELYDDAVLVTADSDQFGPIQYITKTYPKRVIVGFPPGRTSTDLKTIASATFHIGSRECSESQFPDEVISQSGYPLRRPHSWR